MTVVLSPDDVGEVLSSYVPLRFTRASAEKVGPEGYKHGWIYVGTRGGRVTSPHGKLLPSVTAEQRQDLSQKVKEYKKQLTPAHQSAIEKWTASRGMVRRMQQGTAAADTLQHFDEALQGAPKVNGLVYRAVKPGSAGADVAESLKPGDHVTIGEPVSTSIDPRQAAGYGSYLYEIDSPAAAYISGIGSRYAYEKEAVLAPGQFHVASIDDSTVGLGSITAPVRVIHLDDVTQGERSWLPTTGSPLTVSKAAGGGPSWPGWQHDLQLVKTYAARLSQALKLSVADAQQVLQQWLNGNLPVTKAQAVLMLGQRVGARLAAVLQDLWREAWFIGDRSAAAMVMQTAVDWGAWQPGDPEAAALVGASADGFQALLDTYGVSEIKALSDTGMDRFLAQLGDTLLTGDSAGALARKIEPLINPPSRAQTIAVTEVARAVSAATLHRYIQDGVTRKDWLVAPDERVCKSCLDNEAAGAILTSALFPSGVPAPPAHPRCRCAATPAEVHGVDLTNPDSVMSDAVTLAAEAELVKVGPKGYIHGWIYVGGVSSGSGVNHPTLGAGTVTGFSADQVTARFGSETHTFDRESIADQVQRALSGRKTPDGSLISRTSTGDTSTGSTNPGSEETGETAEHALRRLNKVIASLPPSQKPEISPKPLDVAKDGPGWPPSRDAYIIDDYTSPDSTINKDLRASPSVHDIRADEDDEVLDIDAMMSKHKTTSPAVLYRGFTTSPQTLSQLTPGQVFGDHAFVSTASDPEWAKEFALLRAFGESPDKDTLPMVTAHGGKPVIMKIDAPAGSHMIIGESDISEYVLPRDSHFKVDSVSADGSLINVSLLGAESVS